MIRWDAFDLQAQPTANSLQRLLEFGTFGEHRVSISRTDVVQIDVHRQARDIKDEEVERGPAFQRDARLQEGVATQ